MAFKRPGYFTWDFWLADDGDSYHLFYLHAPRSLGNPDLRHRNARVGHATSPDLKSWTDHGEVLGPGPEGSFDGTATWTGSVVRGPDGLWRMFYTGSRFLGPDTSANVETIGLATSPDLFAWTKQPGPILTADARWYETLGSSSWPEEAFRDPWVFQGGDGVWHMLVTARARDGIEPDRGVMGHATSTDLAEWTAAPPLSAPGSGFAHLEVFQVVSVDGQPHMVFCCDTPRLVGPRAGQRGGTWTLPVGSMPGEVDFSRARLLVDETLYAGRIALDRQGRPWLLAFANIVRDGEFAGGLPDPIALVTDADGYLTVAR